MNLTPITRASIAAAIVYVPYALGMFFYLELLSGHAWFYVGFLSFLASGLVYQWVYHRAVAKLPVTPAPVPELNLVAERLPAVVWSAALPPILVAVLLWWVTTYGSALPWRDSWLGPVRPVTSHSGYKFMLISILPWISFTSLFVVYALARWHGMSRAYASRRNLLLHAVQVQWIVMVGQVASACTMCFYTPGIPAAIVGLTSGASFLGILPLSGRAHALRAELRAERPRVGTWWYFDFRDPAFLGPRGLNLANGWWWLLAGMSIAPLLVAEWMLHGVPG